MHARSLLVGTSALSLALSVAVLSAPAHAGVNFTISVPDATVLLKETFTVNGTGAPCANAPYTVTFTYVNHAGNPATTQATGTTDPDNEFSQTMTVPEAATPDQPASVQATVTCEEPSPSPSAAQAPTATSNTVNIVIDVATGVLSTNKTSGRAGTVVQVSGTNCLGDEVLVVFGNNGGADVVAVTLLANDTFSGSYTIPNVPAGSYFFAAACPGTDYADRPFTVLATPGSSPSPLPGGPANPVPGDVDFTG